MLKDIERIQAARRVKATAKANIDFLKERIRKQNEPGFNRYATASGAAMRIYYQADIDEQQAKLDRAKEIINSYKNTSDEKDKF